MSSQFLQLFLLFSLAVIGGVTAGQYPAQRRRLRGCDFRQWRSRRLTMIVLLAGVIYFLPFLLKNVSLASLLGS